MHDVSMRAEWAPSDDPFANPTSYTWQPLAGILSYSNRCGRQSRFGAMEPAKVDLVLDGNTVSLDPLDPGSVTAANPRPFTPIRVLATVDGVDHVRFTGYITDGWKPDHARRSRAKRWTVTATDWMGWAATRPLPPSRLEAVNLYDDPMTAIKGELSDYEISSASGGGFAFHTGYGTPVPPYAFVTSRAGSPRTVNEVAPLLGDTPGIRFFVPDAYLQLTGLPATQATRAAFTVRVAVRITEPPVVGLLPVRQIIHGHSGGTLLWSITYNGDGRAAASMYTTAGDLAAGATVSTSDRDAGVVVNNGDVWVIEAVFVRSTRTVTLRVRNASTPGGAATVTGTASDTTTLAMGSPQVRIGDTTQTISTVNGQEIGHVALYERAVSIADSSYLGAQSLGVWGSQNIAARVGRFLAVANADVPVSVPAHSWILAGWGGEDADLAGAMTAIGESIGGSTVAQRDGTVRVADYADTTAGTPAFAFTDEPTPTGTEDPVRYSGGGRSPIGLDRLVNRAVISFGLTPSGSPPRRVRANDFASQARYGVREWTSTSKLRDDQSGQLRAIAEAVVVDGADPTADLDDVTIDPLARTGPDHTNAVAAAMALWLLTPVRYVETDQVTGDTLVDATYRVQGIAEDWERGRDWRLAYRITPDPT